MLSTFPVFDCLKCIRNWRQERPGNEGDRAGRKTIKQKLYQFVFSPRRSSQRRCHLVGSQVPSTWWAAAPQHPLSPVGSSSWSRRPQRDQSRPPWSHHRSQSWGGEGGRERVGITSVEGYITGVNLKAGENTVWNLIPCIDTIASHSHLSLPPHTVTLLSPHTITLSLHTLTCSFLRPGLDVQTSH